MKDGEREQPIEKYGKKEQKEWLDNILSDPHPCTAGNKEEEHKLTNPRCNRLICQGYYRATTTTTVPG